VINDEWYHDVNIYLMKGVAKNKIQDFLVNKGRPDLLDKILRPEMQQFNNTYQKIIAQNE
jgi:hypothetical protein